MKEKVLSMIALITVFVPLTAAFVWKSDSPAATAIIIGYCIFAAVSFVYALFLFVKMKLRDINTKIALGVNAVYVVGILVTVIIPHLLKIRQCHRHDDPAGVLEGGQAVRQAGGGRPLRLPAGCEHTHADHPRKARAEPGGDHRGSRHEQPEQKDGLQRRAGIFPTGGQPHRPEVPGDEPQMSREAPQGLRPVLYRSYPIGTLALMDDGTGLSRVFLCQSGSDRPAPQGETELTRWAAAELDEYFSGRRTTFTVPLSPRGTPFQLAVWAALRAIPFGQTRTYGEIAAGVGRPKAARAVGMANHHNPLLIFTPCHRVVGRGGSLTGFACGLAVKRALLALEGAELSHAKPRISPPPTPASAVLPGPNSHTGGDPYA